VRKYFLHDNTFSLDFVQIISIRKNAQYPTNIYGKDKLNGLYYHKAANAACHQESSPVPYLPSLRKNVKKSYLRLNIPNASI
jgi:hypothetical protein